MAGVPAGRLSIEIVAEIARLQQDLDKAKRAVAAASGDIAKSAMHANDNLSRMGTAMTGVGRISNAMRANMINLGRQVQDVGTMFAMGASPMQIFTSQAAQIVDVLTMMRVEAAASNTSLTRMAAGGLVRIGPYALAAAAAGGALALVMQDITDEINENSSVTVTWGDVLLGTFDAVKAYVGGVLTSAFEALGIDVGSVFDFIANAARAKANQIIGHYVFAVNAIKAAWRTFPGAIAEFLVDAANRAIQTIEGMVNGGISALNMFARTINSVMGRDLVGTLSPVDIPELANRWRGAGSAAGAAMAEAQASSYRDYLGDFVDFVSPYAQARARRRMESDAEDAGRSTGRAAGRAAGREMAEQTAMSFEDAFKDLMGEIDLANEVAGENTTMRDRLSGLQREAAAIGLVGWQREQLILTLEYQADAQAILARMAIAESNGQSRVVDALRDQLALRRQVYDQQISTRANDNEIARMQERWGEMDDWLANVNKTAEQMQMAFEQVRMDGLDALTDGLVDAMTGFRSLGDVARSVLSQILADLLRLQIQQSIIGPLASALGMMGSAGGPSAGLLGSVTQAFAANPGLFAKGTLAAPAGLAIVGEQGPELVNLRGGERIYPAGQTKQMLNGGSTTFNITVGGAMNSDEARRTGTQVGAAAAKQFAQARRSGLAG